MNTETLGDRIRKTRMELGLTQAEVAKRAKVTSSAISNLEQNTRFTSRSLLAIAAALGVSANWLETGIGEKRTDKNESASFLSPVPISGSLSFTEGLTDLFFPTPPNEKKFLDVRFGGHVARSFLIIGDGLAPKIRDHEYIVTSQSRSPKNGDVVFLQWKISENQGRFSVMHYLYSRGEKSFFSCLNKDDITAIASKNILSMESVIGILPDWISNPELET